MSTSFVSLKKYASLALWVSLLLSGSGCSSTPKEYTSDVYAMNTVISLSAWGEDGKEALALGQEYLYSVDNQFSATRETSELYQLNQTSDEWVNISLEMQELLYFSMEMAVDTNHTFDPTIAPLVKAWGFTESSHQVPTEEEIQALLPYVDASLVELDYKNQQVYLSEGVSLDFGAIAKGYAADQLVKILEQEKVTCAKLDLGGTVYVKGTKIDGSLWNIGVQNPYGGGYVGTLRLQDKAVITSGGYQRYFMEEGTVYHHIIDPRTGFPATSGLGSVTIICDSGARGDALSTALFVSGLEDAVDYWKRYENFDMILVTTQGDVYVTPNLDGNFTLVSGYTQGELKVIS